MSARNLLSCALCLVVGAAAGVSVSVYAAPPPSGVETEAVPKAPSAHSRYRKIDQLARALSLIEQHYVRPVDGEQLMHGAMDGLVSELDPHSDFLPPQEATILREDISGRFGGVGLVVVLERVEGRPVLVVRDVIPGGPAAGAGVATGDRIVTIEGKGISQFADLREAIMVMRGKPGTHVRFQLEREGAPPRALNIARAVVDPPAVEVTDLGEGFGWLRLRDFQEASALELQRGLQELRRANRGGDNRLRGVVLDLRDNGGGLLDQAIGVVDLFVAEGPIVRTRGRRGQLLEEVNARGPGTAREVPLVVLINKASASASEIVAGALQDHRRALILGERSYGKGSVQAPFELGDGSVLKLTTALYYTPDDRLIQASGIAPDVEVGMQRKTVEDSRPELEPERASPRHLEPEDFGRKSVPKPGEDAPKLSPAIEKAGEDGQLIAAIEHLRAWDRVRPTRRARRTRRAKR